MLTFDQWYENEYLPNAVGCHVGSIDDMRDGWEAAQSHTLPCGHPAACGEPCGWCAEVAALRERLEHAGDSMPEAE